MAANKLKYLFSKESRSADPKGVNRPTGPLSPREEKEIVQQLRNNINSKLKDPKAAKKAAAILSEMIAGTIK